MSSRARDTAASRSLRFRRPEYCCFSDVRNHLNGGAVLDWLERYGAAAGYRAPEGVRSDFSAFVMQCGITFEDWVVNGVVKPALVGYASNTEPSGVDHVERFADLSNYTRYQQQNHMLATLDALQQRETVLLYQPFFVDKTRGWYGHPDLVVRRDALSWLELVLESAVSKPSTNSSKVAHMVTPIVPTLHADQPHPGWCIVDIKYSSTLSNKLLYQAQLWIYELCLNDMQPDHPNPVCTEDLYLLGRAGKLTKAFSQNKQVGIVESSLANARDWMRTVDMNEAAEWKIVPVPSVRELMVSPNRDETTRWDSVLNKIAAEQGDVCAVYKVGPAARAKLVFPPLQWWDPRCTAKYLGVRPDDQAQVDQMLVAARKVRNHEPIDPPKKLSWVEAIGIPRAVHYCIVAFDFEFVYDLHLDKSFKTDTQSWVFCIAAGHVSSTSNPQSSWVDCIRTETGELTSGGELQLMERWLTWMKAQQIDNATVYAVHWSQAEMQCLKRVRAKVVGGTTLSDLFLWWDRCVVPVDAMVILTTNKVVIPGCMEYGLKAVYSNLFPAVQSQESSGSLASLTLSSSNKPPKSKRSRVVSSSVNCTPPQALAPELSATGLVGDTAALIAYDCATHKHFSLVPDEAMCRVMEYNMDDVRMTAAVWNAVIRD